MTRSFIRQTNDQLRIRIKIKLQLSNCPLSSIYRLQLPNWHIFSFLIAIIINMMMMIVIC